MRQFFRECDAYSLTAFSIHGDVLSELLCNALCPTDIRSVLASFLEEWSESPT